MKKKQKPKKIRALPALIFLFALLIALICAILIKKQNSTAAIVRFTLPADRSAADLKIVLLSDLHNAEFGEDNTDLIAQIQTETPDLICMTGDMLNGDEPDFDIICDLIQQTAAIAPVYFSYGNHEGEYEERYGVSLRPLLEAAGAHVLEREYEEIEINGQALRIGGLYGYAMPTQTEFDGEEQRFMEDFQETDAYKILLCHMPVAWIQWGSLDFWDVDLVLSGHTHGGQIKVPFLGGMYAPDQEWFPDFTDGLLQKDGKSLVVSAGLGAEGLPRINNKPQIVVVEVTAQP